MDSGACSTCGAGVKDKGHKCGQCLSATYCSKECQVSHWRSGHKNACKRLASEVLRRDMFHLGSPEDLIDMTLAGIDASDAETAARLERVIALTWNLRISGNRELLTYHMQCLAARSSSVMRGPSDAARDRLLKVLLRALTEVPWPEVPKDEDDLVVYPMLLDDLLKLQKTKEVLQLLEQHVPMIEKNVRRKSTILQFQTLWIETLIKAAKDCEPHDDATKRAYVKQAQDSAGKATTILDQIGMKAGEQHLHADFMGAARSLAELHLYDFCISFSRRALDLAPRSLKADYAVTLAAALYATRRTEEAEGAAQLALEWAKDLQYDQAVAEAGAFVTLARVARDRSELPTALQYALKARRAAHDFIKLRRYNPNLPAVFRQAIITVADICEDLGKLKDACEHDRYLEDFQFQTHSGVVSRQGLWLAVHGQMAEAEEKLREAVEMAEKGDDGSSCGAGGRLDERRRRPLMLLHELLEKRGTREAVAEAKQIEQRVKRIDEETEAMRRKGLEEVRSIVTAEAVERKGSSAGRRGTAGWEGANAGGAGARGVGADRAKKGGKRRKGGARKKGQGGQATPVDVADNLADVSIADGDSGAAEQAAATEHRDGGTDQNGYDVHDGHEESGVENECAICFLAMAEDDGDAIGVLACSHAYHDHCLDLWAGKCAEMQIDATCPHCRATLKRK